MVDIIEGLWNPCQFCWIAYGSLQFFHVCYGAQIDNNNNDNCNSNNNNYYNNLLQSISRNFK